MKQKIPFSKDITFKTKIGEITSISLDNDLTLKGEDLISGNFYISGTYKMLEASTALEEYSYKIPCDIAISSEYDTFDATIDIDDFYYEVIDDEILRVNIVVEIDGLTKKEEEIEVLEEEPKEEPKPVLEDTKEVKEEKEPEEKLDNLDLDNEERDNKSMSFLEVKEKVKNQNDTYLTYKVYVMTDGDTVDSVLEKYNITKDELEDYNNLDDITVGSKLVIPSTNND